MENGPVEIVDLPIKNGDLPIYKKVDLSSWLCKRLPFRVLGKMLESPTEK